MEVDAETADLSASCRRAALAVTEENVEGFLLLVMSPDEKGSKIVVEATVPDDAWPAFTESMGRIETFAQEHGHRSS